MKYEVGLNSIQNYHMFDFYPGLLQLLTDPGAKKQVVLVWLSYLTAAFFIVVSTVLGSFSPFFQL